MNAPQPVEERLEAAWRDACHDRFLAAPSRPEPDALLVTGLPGAGKSVLAGIVASEPGWARLDAHELWLLHPGFVVLGQAGDGRACLELNDEAVRLAGELCERAVQRRMNLVVECSFADRRAARFLVRHLKRHGYRVVVVAVVVSPDTARKAAGERNRRVRQRVGVARVPDPDQRETGPDVLAGVLEALERSRAVDEFYFVTREGQCLAALDASQRPWMGASRRALASVCGEQPSDSSPVTSPASPADADTERRRQFQRTLRQLADAERAASH